MFYAVGQLTLIIVTSAIIIILLFGIRFVPKNKVYIVERMGVYYTTWKPGIHFLLLGFERVREKIITNDHSIHKCFEITDGDKRFNFEIQMKKKIINPTNFAYRKDIVLYSLDEIIFNELNILVLKGESFNFDQLLKFSEEILFKVQNHADLIDLEIITLKIILL